MPLGSLCEKSYAPLYSMCVISTFSECVYAIAQAATIDKMNELE